MKMEPELVLKTIEEKDPYLLPYIKGWWLKGPAQPWGAAHGFALEVAKGYGLIKSESDTTPTSLGSALRELL